MANVTVQIPIGAADALCMAALLLAESRRSFNALPADHPLADAVNESCEAVDRTIAQFAEHGGEPVRTRLLAKAYEIGWVSLQLNQEVGDR